jgi:hypothetical protein
MNKFEEQTFQDHKGYLRWKDSNRLVHRTIAYKQIYLKNEEKYPLDFKDYQIHHKDQDKTNNRVENLELKERKAHEEEHKFIRREKLHLIYIKVLVFGMIGIFAVEELTKKFGIVDLRKGLMFAFVFFLSLIIALWLSREKKGKKYI